MAEHEEEWRTIAGYEGRYEVSSIGRVRSLQSRSGRRKTPLMMRFKLTNGYQNVSLRCGRGVSRGFFVHVLVLEAFVGPRPGGLEVRHFPDPCRTNNALTNLSWATRKQNAADKIVHGTVARGERCGAAKLSNAQAKRAQDLLAQGETCAAVGRELGVSRSAISLMKRGLHWRLLGTQPKPKSGPAFLRALGLEIRRLAIANGYRHITDLARRTGLSGATLSRIENGVGSRPHNDTLRLIASKLGVSADELAAAASKQCA
jgi:uncharacterized protein YerC